MGLKNFAAKMIGKMVAKKLELREGSMEGKIKWWQSKTVWSDIVTGLIGVLGVVSPILSQYGVNIPEIPAWLLTVLAAMGIHGRVTATKSISQ